MTVRWSPKPTGCARQRSNGSGSARGPARRSDPHRRRTVMSALRTPEGERRDRDAITTWTEEIADAVCARPARDESA
jgi:hypothetical protein